MFLIKASASFIKLNLITIKPFIMKNLLHVWNQFVLFIEELGKSASYAIQH